MASPKEPLKSCSHREYMKCGAKNSGFIWLHLALVDPAWSYVRACLKKLYICSHFAKRFTKIAPALSMELFIEPKPKIINDFTYEVEPCQTGS
jgi:hypothetical protein